MPVLETVTIPAVEVLSTGGPVHGQGSPPEGDFWSREDLERIAAANVALAAEIKAPMKIGHSDAQTLVANSALAALTPGEMPAVGWLDGSTARVVDDGDGAKLVMDAKAVPRAFGDLIDAGAYRTRSSELSRVTSQVSGTVYDWVVTGLAWLGAKLPAVQTLDDVVALYASRSLERDDRVRAYVVYAASTSLPAGVKVCSMKGTAGYSGGGACHMHDGTDTGKAAAMKKAKADAAKRANAAADGTLVWTPDSSFQALRDDVNEALNGPPTGGATNPRFWVADIALSGDAALVQDYYEDGDDGWVVPFTVNGDGSIAISPSSDWQPVEQGWVATANEYAAKFGPRAESRSMELTLTDEQAAEVRTTLGLEADAEITPESLVEASTARANELAAAKTAAADAETRKLEASDLVKTVRKLEADVKVEQTRRFELERDTDLTAAVRAGKIDPAQLDDWKKDYEENQAGTRRILERLKSDPDLVREFGRDDGEETGAQTDEEYQRDFERRHGMKATV